MPDRPAVMPLLPTITFDSPVPLAIGLALAITAMVIAAFRRVSAPLLSYILVGFGLALVAIAVGEPHVARDADQRVAVMVDLSASTRGAAYHDEQVLRADIEQLLRDRPYTITRFGDGNNDRTTWTPPAPGTAAVLLFSDGRFEPPATSPPVYAVIDPALNRPADAAVTSLEHRGDQLVVTTANTGPPRQLWITGATAATQPIAPSGTRTIAIPAASDATNSMAQLHGADTWPENDALSLMTPPPAMSERWWIGDGAPSGDWRRISADELPTDPAAWLAPSVIVLHNIPAGSIPPAQAERLHQYIRDLGGGLLILGGNRAFAAGGYEGSVLGDLSPLASSPPTPAAHWTFLLDASGSMAGADAGRTRLSAAVAAAKEAIAQLPPNDLLSVGGFSDELQWWMRGVPVRDRTLPDVPAPRGSTNLEPALRAVSASLDRTVANPIVLMTDGQVQLPAADEIAKALAAANARVHVFAIGTGTGLPALRQLAEATGGTFAEETDAARWAAGLAALLRQVSPHHWMTTPVEVHFTDLPSVTAPAWNRTWLKAGADELARTTGEDAVPMAARTNVGSGAVAAVAFRPPDAHVEAMTALVQSPPRDPRLMVSWRTGRDLIIELDAVDDAQPINGLSPTVVLSTPAGSSETFSLPQTAPGRYALTLAAPRSSVLATLHASGRVIDRFAVAGRYAAEFDGIGNDHEALASLAKRTGGRIIEPHDRRPLSIRARGATWRLTPYLAAAGALLIGLGLVAWRIKR